MTVMDKTSLNPEDIAELQKQQCVFCHIVNDRVASKKVYQDDKFVAVLDINPANPGHMLVLSKEHYMIMPQVPEEDVGYLGMLTKALSLASLRALNSQGTSVFVANGVVAGQRAQHFILHIIPRMENDRIGLEIPERELKTDKELKKKIIKSVWKAFGLIGFEDGLQEELNEEKIEGDQVKKEEKQKKAEELKKTKMPKTNLDEIADFLTKNG